MISVANLISGIYIHKAGIGKIRENCIYAKNLAEVPAFLLEDGAIKANPDGSITLYA